MENYNLVLSHCHINSKIITEPDDMCAIQKIDAMSDVPEPKEVLEDQEPKPVSRVSGVREVSEQDLSKTFSRPHKLIM